MQKRHAKKISVLIVPEDNAEPYSFSLRSGVAKILYVVASVLLVHIILGFVFYWKYADLMDQNENLAARNGELQHDNKRVIALAEKVRSLEGDYRKVRSLLGVEPDYEEQIEPDMANGNGVQYERIVPTTAMESPANGSSAAEVSRQRRFLLTPRKSKLHSSVENMPTMLPVQGFLTLDFQSHGWFAPKAHTGIDIVAKKGTIVQAAGAGTIIFSNWTIDLGYLVIIDHGNDILSYYGHNQRLLAPEKTAVKKGEPIALLGSSGKSSGPHLHFEVWKDGTPVDPKEYLLAFK